MRRKLKSKKGETLVETLAALLVVALGTATFAGMVNVSSQINGRAIDRDRSYYTDLTRAETVAEWRTGTVTVTDEGSGDDTVEVIVSQKENSGLVSYRVGEKGAAP